ncbi:TM0106 family RecB-like putative nuclease [Pleurocapsa sp. FMAR1]|uniref:TM0106 family RecB-like putative nuclease n=1 Tax=Pleurocapsa sp. FMAR1 TaxID=3040204 RepID=UPI0029C6FEB6|nr:TM0106 family RecB-like putative nuclease [Pleurocapsa sp. FMAR1]
MLITDHLLLNYKRCNRRTYLEIYGNPQQKDPEKDFLQKLKRENQTHIANVIKERSLDYYKPDISRRDWQLNSQQTLALMAQGVECIAQGSLSLTFAQWQTALSNYTFSSEIQDVQDFLTEITFVAAPSLLIRQPGKSKFGDWEYLPVNIKLGRRAKPEYKLISAFHAQILGITQSAIPAYSQLILKEHNDYYINLDHWLIKMQHEVTDCLVMLAQKQKPEVFISRQRCSLCSWYGYCHGVAKSSNHLSLVPGVTPKRYEYMQSMGVDSVESLINVSEKSLGEALTASVARQIKQQITALQSDRALVKSSFDLLNTQPIPSGAIELYFDIEAEPERQIDYLLGVLLVDRTTNTEKFHAFVAEDAADEEKIWQQFLNFISLYPDAPIFHYSEYEADTIKRLARLYDTPKAKTKELLSRLVDLHLWVTKTVVLPVESYSLKALANWIGFYWRETQGSGDQSVCWYDRWLSTQDRTWLELILSYNEDDCRATRHLKDWLLDFLEHQRNQQIAVNK